MGDDLPPTAPQTPSNLRRNTNDATLDDRASRPPRPPRRTPPTRALLLPRHRLALRRARQRRIAPPQRGHSRRRRARRQFLPREGRRGCQLGIHGRRPPPVLTSWRERAAHHRRTVPARVAHPRREWFALPSPLPIRCAPVIELLLLFHR